MKVETRIFSRGTADQRRQLVLIPTPEESELIDWAVGSQIVDNDGLIAPVIGVVKLEDGFGVHYIRLEKDNQ